MWLGLMNKNLVLQNIPLIGNVRGDRIGMRCNECGRGNQSLVKKSTLADGLHSLYF